MSVREVPASFIASQKVPKLIDTVQHQAPSGKFQMKLIEREKQRQFEMMESRVRKLQIDQKRAEKALKQTMDTHERAE